MRALALLLVPSVLVIGVCGSPFIAFAQPTWKNCVPANETSTIKRTSCPSSTCTSGCKSITIPGGKCVPSESGGSTKFTCGDGRVTEDKFSDGACTESLGPPVDYPTNQCVLDVEENAYTEWTCEPPPRRLREEESTVDVRGPTTQVQSLQIVPYPIVVNENYSLQMSGYLAENITSLSGIGLNFRVEQLVLGVWVEIPCINGIGSCKFKNVCDVVANISGNMKCPQTHGRFDWTTSHRWPSIGGDYKTTMALVHGTSVLGCLELTFTVADSRHTTYSKIKQTECSNSACTASCRSVTFPTEHCLQTSESGVYVKTACSSDGSSFAETLYSDSSCSRPTGSARTFPTVTCEEVQGGNYAEWECVST